LFAIYGKSKAQEPAIRFPLLLADSKSGDVEMCKHAPERFRVVAAIEMLIGNVIEGHLLRAHEVLEADLMRLNPGLAGDRIEDQFECEANPSARDASVRKDRAFIRGRRPGPAPVGLEIVRAGQDARHLCRLKACGKWIGGVGTGIDRCL